MKLNRTPNTLNCISIDVQIVLVQNHISFSAINLIQFNNELLKYLDENITQSWVHSFCVHFMKICIVLNVNNISNVKVKEQIFWSYWPSHMRYFVLFLSSIMSFELLHCFTMLHILNECPVRKFVGGIKGLHQLEEGAS